MTTAGRKARSERLSALGHHGEFAPGGLDTDRSISVLIIDERKPFIAALERELIVSGITSWTARSFCEATEMMNAKGTPSYILSELKVNGKSLVDFMNEVAGAIPAHRFIVGTVYPSVATAVFLTRMGIAGYLAQPISVASLLEILVEQRTPGESTTTAAEPMTWPTLDRTIWEYLSHVHLVAGSISEAARRLGVDRRSLRRMLAKYPPHR